MQSVFPNVFPNLRFPVAQFVELLHRKQVALILFLSLKLKI